MLCDELKDYDYDPDFPFQSRGRFYVADEVETAIAELKEKLIPCLNGDCILTCEVVEKYGKENAELKAEINRKEAVGKRWFERCMEARTENVRLKRALWLSRAERASDKARMFYFAVTCGVELNIDGFSNKEKGRSRMGDAISWRKNWLKVERKCRAKAEEYK